MRKQDWTQIGAYVLVGALSIGGAFLVSLKFLTPSGAQDSEEAALPAPEAPAAGGVTGNAENAVNALKGRVSESEAAAAAAAGMPVEDPTGGRGVPNEVINPDGTTSTVQGQGPGSPGGGAGAGGGGAEIDVNDPAPIKSAGSDTSGISELEGFLEPFIYDETNRRDPFVPYSEYIPPTDGLLPGQLDPGMEEDGRPRILAPQQKYELYTFKLVGIVWDVKQPKAMFMSPNQELFILGRDENIGGNNGYIAAIREGEVVVVESSKRRGDVTYKTRVIRIER
jgi:type IV pilus assembly protein PilP